MNLYRALSIKFFLLNSYLTTGRRKSWPHALKLMDPGGLTLGVYVGKTMILTATLAKKIMLGSFCQ